MWFPSRRTKPYPVKRLPGSTPRMSGFGTPAASGLEAAERFVRDVEIGEEFLDVVMILEQFHELQGQLGVLIAERDHVLRHFHHIGRRRGDSLRRQGGLH